MSDHVTDHSEVPSASHYVLMRDTFFSGWGPAEGKDAIYIFPCDGEQDASTVVANANARGDQDRIEVVRELPAFKDGWHVMLTSAANSARWYQPGGFAE